MSSDEYRRRFADCVLEELLRDVPALFVTGPRGCGKTTTASRHSAARVSLDIPGVASAAQADPDVFLNGQEHPLLIDEWQEAPSVLGALKRAVDGDAAAGQFIVTGSVRSELAPGTWPGTGRLVRVPMAPMAQREVLGFDDALASLFLHRAFAEEQPQLVESDATIADYVDLALRGGFPEVVRTSSDRVRRAWLESYSEQLLTRDITSLGETVDGLRLRQYVEVLSLNTAGILAQSSLAAMAGITVKTSERYDQLLTDVGIVDNLLPWSRNRIARVEKRPKRFVVDTGIAMAAARLDRDSILRDGTLMGRFLEALVYMQLRAEVLAADNPMRLFHLRTANGRQEIDFVVEGPGGSVVGIEVKASAQVTAHDARHLRWLKEQTSSKWRAGFVLHSGRNSYPLGDGIWALPVAALWVAPS